MIDPQASLSPENSIRWIAQRGGAQKLARLPSAGERRRTGLVLGAAAGLLYGAAAHAVNAYLLAGVPLHQPPFGPVGNTLLLGAAGASAGLITAWPASSLTGAMLGCVVTMALLEARAWLTGVGTPLLRLLAPEQALFVLMAAAVALAVLVPFALVLRWAVDEAGERFERVDWRWARLRPVQTLMGVALLLGVWAYYPAEVREAMRDMDRLVSQALMAMDDAGLPAPLRTAAVPDFIGRATRRYALSWGDDSLAADALRQAASQGTLSSGQTTVTAHFSSGYILVCAYDSAEAAPRCRAE